MIFVSVFCLAVAASALPTPESPRKVFFAGPDGVKADKNVVGFTITPQDPGFKPENGLFIPKAPQLSPVYLMTFEKSKPKSSEGNEGDKDGNKKDNKKDAEQQFQLVRIDVFTDVLEPVGFLVLNVFNELFSILFSSGEEEEESRSYYMVMTK